MPRVAGQPARTHGQGMSARVLVITGTDTGVGKTVLTCLLARHLRQAGVAVAALKPVCSGGRLDARRLVAASRAGLSLDEVNPWHFRAPVAPLLAARQLGVRLTRAEVLQHIRALRRRFEWVLVEGAGGLLSPLAENLDTRDLIAGLRAWPIVVCPNRLGAINQALLVFEALPRAAAARAQLVLMSPRPLGGVGRGNVQILAERLGAGRVHLLPWLPAAVLSGRLSLPPSLRPALDRLLAPARPGFTHRPRPCAR